MSVETVSCCHEPDDYIEIITDNESNDAGLIVTECGTTAGVNLNHQALTDLIGKLEKARELLNE